jgi:hypothetical protein
VMSVWAKGTASGAARFGLAQDLAQIQLAEEQSDLPALGRGQVARTTRGLAQKRLQPSAALRR